MVTIKAAGIFLMKINNQMGVRTKSTGVSLITRGKEVCGHKVFVHNQCGVSALEFAIIAPILITVFVGVLNLGLVLIARFNLENLVYTASSYVITFGTEPSGDFNVFFEDGKRNAFITSPYEIDKFFYDQNEDNINCTNLADCPEAAFVEIIVSTNINGLLFERFSPDSISARAYFRLQ